MKMIKYQHKLRDKAGGNTPAFTLHHIPTVLVIFLMRLRQRRFIEMNQFRRLSCSRGANSFSSPSLEYCSAAAGGGCQVNVYPGFTTLRNTSQFKHPQIRRARRVSVTKPRPTQTALSPQNALEHPHARLNSESKEKYIVIEEKQCTENYIRYRHNSDIEVFKSRRAFHCYRLNLQYFITI